MLRRSPVHSSFRCTKLNSKYVICYVFFVVVVGGKERKSGIIACCVRFSSISPTNSREVFFCKIQEEKKEKKKPFATVIKKVWD
jgi:c-di-GMP-binding flagellar brake protein YcgR